MTSFCSEDSTKPSASQTHVNMDDRESIEDEDFDYGGQAGVSSSGLATTDPDCFSYQLACAQYDHNQDDDGGFDEGNARSTAVQNQPHDEVRFFTA